MPAEITQPICRMTDYGFLRLKVLIFLSFLGIERPMERLHLLIRGVVQGVFFRASTQKQAAILGLVGWVRNTADGGVEAVAEGERQTLERFCTWCWKGPPSAHVEQVSERWEPATGEFRGFHIR